MPHYLVEYSDSGDAAARAAHRADHIAYRKSLGARLPLAGTLLDASGEAAGSLVIIEAEGQGAAANIAADDPLVAAGVLTLISVRPYRIAAMKPPAA